ncbi:hypothetical protein MNBD_ALPHA11-884 [hydrothermal vent metagenome]|uniref:Uncharacterized protein n=1 Tax=hydrothermal vent metagenome TaxID=652676 RepID=A0A3B0U9G5_9ZZZZ
MSLTYLSSGLLKMDIIPQTFQALRILLVNALINLENHAVSGVFSPAHKQNTLTQNG